MAKARRLTFWTAQMINFRTALRLALRLDDMPIGINHVVFNSGIGMDSSLMLLTISDDED
jgi:hypothetical protein